MAPSYRTAGRTVVDAKGDPAEHRIADADTRPQGRGHRHQPGSWLYPRIS